VSALHPPGPLQRQQPARRRRRSAPRRRRSRLGWRVRLAAGISLAIAGFVTWAVLARLFAPLSNTGLTRFDAIIVLGTPADSDGNPTPEQLSRVTEAVHEYERGMAPRLILSGGAAHNAFVEADVMARAAQAQGIPQSSIFIEPRAQDTIQNGCYSARIMRAHGWRSAEVVSSVAHLPRAGLIFSHLPIDWRTHAASPMGADSQLRSAAAEVIEIIKTARYLLYTSWAERCEP
jgi:uncharacterized SAM-binding protein YcdF (DUF218 family)